MPESGKHVYYFSPERTEGDATFKELLGGKGANLAEMSRIGLPVPAGFTITTQVCVQYVANNHTYPDGVTEQVEEASRWSRRAPASCSVTWTTRCSFPCALAPASPCRA